MEETKELNNSVRNDVIDITISTLRKQAFRINGDDNTILELNTSDMNLVPRLANIYPKLQELIEDITNMSMGNLDEAQTDEEFHASLVKFGDEIKNIDTRMRDYIDEIFDANVSEICAPYGSMYDIVNGQFRFDDIIDVISKLYTTNIAAETKALHDKLAKKTAKYVPQDRKKSTKKTTR